jgi:hypothetical protein
MRKSILLILSVGLAVGAQAQLPSGNIFFGYTNSGGDVFANSSGLQGSHGANFNGWELSGEGKFLPWIGLVADLSAHYGSHDVVVCATSPAPPCASVNTDSKRVSFMVGPRVSVPVGRFTPFAQAMVGLSHQSDHGGGISNSDTSLITAIGGGIDYKLIPAVAWRLQGDELHTRLFGSAQDHFRFSTGIVVRF